MVGQFLYLEGHEYLMYNTYDVHFYSGMLSMQCTGERPETTAHADRQTHTHTDSRGTRTDLYIDRQTHTQTDL
jgi:Glycosyl-hydrolase family 116, catalytic region